MASITRTDVEDAFQEVVSANVLQYATESSAALQAFPAMRMGTSTYRMPVLAALPTGGWLAADQDVKPSSKATWDGVVLTAEELAVIVPISETAIADANFDVVAAVETLIGQEFGRLIDIAVFHGGGPATFPTGGLNGIAQTATQTIEAGRSNKTIVDDVNELFAIVEDVSDVTHVFGSRSLRASFRGLKDSNGVNIYNPAEGAAGISSLYGLPMRFPVGWDNSDALALAVDSSAVALAIRQDVTMKVLNEATITGFGNLAEKDSIAIRAVMRLAFQVANPVSIRAGARVYPFASYIPDQSP